MWVAYASPARVAEVLRACRRLSECMVWDAGRWGGRGSPDFAAEPDTARVRAWAPPDVWWTGVAAWAGLAADTAWAAEAVSTRIGTLVVMRDAPAAGGVVRAWAQGWLLHADQPLRKRDPRLLAAWVRDFRDIGSLRGATGVELLSQLCLPDADAAVPDGAGRVTCRRKRWWEFWV